MPCVDVRDMHVDDERCHVRDERLASCEKACEASPARLSVTESPGGPAVLAEGRRFPR